MSLYEDFLFISLKKKTWNIFPLLFLYLIFLFQTYNFLEFCSHYWTNYFVVLISIYLFIIILSFLCLHSFVLLLVNINLKSITQNELYNCFKWFRVWFDIYLEGFFLSFFFILQISHNFLTSNVQSQINYVFFYVI